MYSEGLQAPVILCAHLLFQDEFFFPKSDRAKALALARRWKEDGKLPCRLVGAWISKGLTTYTKEGKDHFKRNVSYRVSTVNIIST